MSNNQEFFNDLDKIIGEIWKSKNKRENLDKAILLSQKILSICGVSEGLLKKPAETLNEVVPSSTFRNQKMEEWFQKHPWFSGERVVINLFDSQDTPFEARFFWLSESDTKARIAAGVMLTPNWEDGELYRLPSYKTSIDFFLTSDAKSLLAAVSYFGNLRVIEFKEKLTNTQNDILHSISKIYDFKGLDPQTGLVKEYEPQRTIHRTIWEAFDYTEVNKKFYEGVAELFQLEVQFLAKKNNYDVKIAQHFTSRLMGRILFCWFLKKRGIIDEKYEYFNPIGLSASEYYEEKLKKLFFYTLNTLMNNRTNDDCTTPYLNGGLFEERPLNGTNEKIDKTPFPDDWFIRLFEHFNKFNFTTDESSPEYQQIAIDPEMLGMVFENLLASIVPETASSANERKNKGAFYTPREIVGYMCKESLRQYLKAKLNNQVFDEGINELIDLNDADFLNRKSTSSADLWGVNSDKVRSLLINALDEMKILDPACGSGAFPIGLMQLILKTYNRLNAFFDASVHKHKVADRKKFQKFNIHATKLYILQNIIHGSDIEPMAAEISRLRSWLSIVVDENDEDNIKPLPNLDFKFVCANSLVPLEDDFSLDLLFDGESIKSEREGLIKDFFNVTSPEDKLLIKEKFSSLYSKYTKTEMWSKRNAQLLSWNPFQFEKPADFFDSQVMMNVDKFDIVIGNPPYIHFEKMKEISESIYSKLGYKTYSKRGDIYCLFYEMGFINIFDNGIVCFITSNKWQRAAYGQVLRNYLIENATPRLLIDFAGIKVFKSATVDVSILLATKGLKNIACKAIEMSEDGIENLSSFVEQNHELTTFDKGKSWIILSSLERSIKSKIEKKGIPLKTWNLSFNSGIKTGLNDAFIIDEETKNYLIQKESNLQNLIHPLLRGKDIKRYEAKWSGKYLLVTHNGYRTNQNEYVPKVDVEMIPVLKEYFDTFGLKLSSRADQGKTKYNLRDCAYMDDFFKSKIVWPDIASSPSFVEVESGVFINNTCYMISNPPLGLISYLNSAIVHWLMSIIATDLGESGIRYIKQFIEILPIPSLEDKELYSKLEFFKNQRKYEDIDKLLAEYFNLNFDELTFIKNYWKQ